MAQNEKSGSDLDIFEGLGKKGASVRPPTGRSTPPPPPPIAKRTLLGVTAPTAPTTTAPTTLTPPPVASPGASPSTPSRLPPPPPGRGSLAPVGQGLPATSSVPPPPPAITKPAPVGAEVDMDWDEDDEATHIFDEEKAHADESTHIFDDDERTKGIAAPLPAAGTPAMARPKATLLGLTAPSAPPPPPSLSRPPGRPTPPPPPPYGRSSSFPGGQLPSGFPPPPTINPLLPSAAPTQPGLGLGLPPRSSGPPPMRIGAMPLGSVAPGALPRPPAVPTYPPQARAMEATTMLRPPSRLGLWVVVGLAVAVIVGAVALMMSPSSGRILISVADARGVAVNHVDVFVDGRKQCDTSPCTVPDVAAGSHEVKVLADGYDAPVLQAVAVEAHKDAPMNVTLGASSKGAGIHVSGTQGGVKLYVDDKEIGPLPQEVHDLTPGDHVIKVAGSERYQPLEKHVTVERDRVEDLGTVTLKVLKGKATISLGTPGARVYLVSGADRRELPMLPISVDIDTTKTWSLEASKMGYGDYKQAIGFDDGQAERSYVVSLEPRSVPNWSPAPYSAPAPAPAPRPAPAPAPAAAGEAGEAFLNINSIPASTCFLDGSSLGSTPKVHISVKPGTHSVKFVNADQGLSKTITVSVGAGETKPAVAKLN
jgi:hypothetical protein